VKNAVMSASPLSGNTV